MSNIIIIFYSMLGIYILLNIKKYFFEIPRIDKILYSIDDIDEDIENYFEEYGNDESDEYRILKNLSHNTRFFIEDGVKITTLISIASKFDDSYEKNLESLKKTLKSIESNKDLSEIEKRISAIFDTKIQPRIEFKFKILTYLGPIIGLIDIINEFNIPLYNSKKVNYNEVFCETALN